MATKYFPQVEKQIVFEGRDSKNPLAFRYYDKQQKVGGRTMGEWFRFSIAYWHTMMGSGRDIFGEPSFIRAVHAASWECIIHRNWCRRDDDTESHPPAYPNVPRNDCCIDAGNVYSRTEFVDSKIVWVLMNEISI